MVLHLWGDKAGGPMCALHLGYGIGGILVPQITTPFLTADSHFHHMTETENVTSPDDIFHDTVLGIDEINGSVGSTNNGSANDNGYSTTSFNMLSTKLEDFISPPKTGFESSLFYPYLIVSFVTVLMAIALLIAYFIGKPRGFPKRQGASNISELCNVARCAFGSTGYGILLLSLMFLYYVQGAGGDRAYSKFIYTYSLVNTVSFSKRLAANLTSTFWFSHMFGRLSGIFLFRFVPITIMMFGFISIGLIGSIILSIYGADTPWLLWVGTCLIGYSVSLAFPAGMSWLNLHFRVNSMAVMVLTMGGSCGGILYQYISGYLFEHVHTHSLMYIMLVYSLLLMINMIFLELVTRCVGRKLQTRETNRQGKEMGIDSKTIDPMENETMLDKNYTN